MGMQPVDPDSESPKFRAGEEKSQLWQMLRQAQHLWRGGGRQESTDGSWFSR